MLAVTVVVAMTTLPFALSRSLLVLFFGVTVYVPALLIAMVALIFWRVRERQVSRRIVTFIAAIVIVPTAFGLYTVVTQHRDEITFSSWEFANRDVLRSFMTRDDIIREWDARGFAGNANDSYLVAAHDIGIMSTNEATKWARGRGETVDCEIVDVQKMREAMYIFTTDECVLKS